MGCDSSESLSESEFDYCVDGYMFVPTRPDADTAGHVSDAQAGDASDSEEAVVVIA